MLMIPCIDMVMPCNLEHATPTIMLCRYSASDKKVPEASTLRGCHKQKNATGVNFAIIPRGCMPVLALAPSEAIRSVAVKTRIQQRML